MRNYGRQLSIVMMCSGLMSANELWANSTDIVTADCIVSEPQQVITRLTNTIQAEAGRPYARVDLQAMADIPRLAMSSIRVLTPRVSSRMAIEMTGRDCLSGRERVATVWFKMQAWREVWVYGHDAKAEQNISVAAPRKQLVDTAALQINDDELVGSIEGQWLRQTVTAGAPLLKKQLQLEPLVKRNDVVTIIVQGAGLMLRTKGTALQSGVLGVRIPVQVNGAATSTSALVTGAGEVHVEI